MLATWILCAWALAVPAEETFVGPPAPVPVPVAHTYGPDFIGPPAPEEFWMLAGNSLLPQAPPVRGSLSQDAGLSLDAVLLGPSAGPEATDARTLPSALRSPRVGMDRLSGLDDVLTDLERLDLTRPDDHGFRVFYTTGCGPDLRTGYWAGWFPRRRP